MSKNFLRELRKKENELKRVERIGLNQRKYVDLFKEQMDSIELALKLSDEDLSIIRTKHSVHIYHPFSVTAATKTFLSAYNFGGGIDFMFNDKIVTIERKSKRLIYVYSHRDLTKDMRKFISKTKNMKQKILYEQGNKEIIEIKEMEAIFENGSFTTLILMIVNQYKTDRTEIF